METGILFVLGLAFGSFANVISLRYDGEGFLFGKKIIGGRSHCPHCGKTLSWYELIPLWSFLAQGGKCRSCGARLTWQYPLVELLSGVLTAAVPKALAASFFFEQYRLRDISYLQAEHVALLGLWTLAVFSLLVLSLIDLRLRIIPDESHILLAALGLAIGWIGRPVAGLSGSFLGSYAILFDGPANWLWSRLMAAGIALLFFGGIVLITRGRGMGVGDVKLATALGILFGWPDIVIIIALSFVAGALYGLYRMARGQVGMKTAVPFGPFLVLGSFLVFFWGEQILRFYFGLAGL